jgi:Zn ribbon nucleic-acid-binding protein
MAIGKLKSCPRCNGDLHILREKNGWFEECVLCAYRRDISSLIIENTVGQIQIMNEIEYDPEVRPEIQSADAINTHG